MTEQEKAVIEAAVEWKRTRRPIGNLHETTKRQPDFIAWDNLFEAVNAYLASQKKVAEIEPIIPIFFSNFYMEGEVGKGVGQSFISVGSYSLAEELLGRKLNEAIAAVNKLARSK